MTFIAPHHAFRHPGTEARTAGLFGRWTRTPGRTRMADEDSARRAMAIDTHVPAGLMGPSLEHLARIALG